MHHGKLSAHEGPGSMFNCESSALLKLLTFFIHCDLLFDHRFQELQYFVNTNTQQCSVLGEYLYFSKGRFLVVRDLIITHLLNTGHEASSNGRVESIR